jgi:CO/xanthine dehydrogenase Mo-binding subunit
LRSRKADKKPVKLTRSRAERIIAAPSRDLFLAKVKADFSKEGKFLVYKAEFLMNVGAYADCTVNVSKIAGYSAEGVTEWSIS